MTFDGFKGLCNATDSGEDLPPLIRSLLLDARGDWNRAHEIAQDDPSANGAWVHAYLHRKEGDQWNASYWYKRAGKTKPSQGLDQEWEEIARSLL